MPLTNLLRIQDYSWQQNKPKYKHLFMLVLNQSKLHYETNILALNKKAEFIGFKMLKIC